MEEVIRFALLGLGVGSLYALSAQGLIVIYRGSGVLNFALGAIGMIAAYLQWDLHENAGLPFVLSAVLGVAAVAILGALIQVLVMRPLRGASPLSRIVATLGILITAQAAVVLRYGSEVTFVETALPDDVLTISGSITISADRLILLGIGIAISITLWAIYKHTKFGLATSAAAENERAASAVGLSPNLIATANWALGCGLAGVAAILIAPIITLQPEAMTTLILAAMAVALVASFTSFPIALVAGLVLGIAQTEIGRYVDQQGLDTTAPFILIVVLLAMRGRGIPLRDFFLQRLPHVGSGRIRPLQVLGGTAVASALLLVVSDNWLAALTVCFGVALVLLSIVVLTGYSGQISLAQFAIAGFGAWIAGRLVDAQEWPFWAALVAGVVGTVPLGMLFALPAVRTRGISLAIVTLGLGLALELMLFENGAYVGGFEGTRVGEITLFGWNISPIAHPERYAFFALGCFVLAALVVANLRRGRSGLRLLSVRTNERAAAALGVSVPGVKLYAFAVSSALAALGGIVIGFRAESINFSTGFNAFESITAVGYAFIGGIGYVMGPLIGATLAPGSFGAQVTTEIFSEGVAEYVTLAGGIILVLLVLQNQDGVVREMIGQFRWLRERILPRSAAPAAEAVELPGEVRRRVAPATLKAEGVTVKYGPVTAVNGVSLAVEPGQILGVIGPNGAGKTTLIDAVTGFTPISSGRVLLSDVDVAGWSVTKRARAGLGRSFQSLELFEDLTVIDNLRAASDPRDFGAYFRDLAYPLAPPLPGEVVAAIKEFKFEDKLGMTVQDLSYGDRRLLAIARAMALQPSVLLLDEPVAGLGEAESEEIARLVRRLADEWGMAILLVEHDMKFVMDVCDSIVVLDFGTEIAAGPPERVRTDPAVITAYLGHPDEEEEGVTASTGVKSR